MASTILSRRQLFALFGGLIVTPLVAKVALPEGTIEKPRLSNADISKIANLCVKTEAYVEGKLLGTVEYSEVNTNYLLMYAKRAFSRPATELTCIIRAELNEIPRIRDIADRGIPVAIGFGNGKHLSQTKELLILRADFEWSTNEKVASIRMVIRLSEEIEASSIVRGLA